ncbi:zinc ABC transporter substrate-binding protein [Oscillatoria sp. FACHB-1406]|uniref:metal ABC transporter solute-binding protein, Zn/Mn family n=1 Tax=Oscillatoria sp. FACHB-1406 TaxID=2692846 RepID=UPI0016834A0B|nr:zinc ABC transporter substrate-binding protein [Oscillatoria sp. FACHB-1406]MBD2577298.1 zinc ABC transporter substrate-binding protein [Oscillatoria sp. FACHB-1406]
MEQKKLRRRDRAWQPMVIAGIAAALAGCKASVPTPSASSTQVKVVATHSILCDLTEQIAKETIALKCLVKGGTDPHVYEPTPDDRRAIEDAQLLLYSGYSLEPSLEKILRSTSNPAPKVAIGEVAVPQPLMGEEHHHEEGEEQHEQGEEKEPDPHVWHDAKNGAKMADAIAQNLAKVAPERAQFYQKNAETLKTELTAIDGWIRAQIATIPPQSRKLVTTHDAIAYYSHAYNLPLEGVLQGLSTEQKPSAARLKALVETIKTSGVPTIFAEATANSNAIATVAKEAKVKISERPLFTDGLGAAGSEGETYQKMLLANTQTIVQGLGGQFSAFRR